MDDKYYILAGVAYDSSSNSQRVEPLKYMVEAPTAFIPTKYLHTTMEAAKNTYNLWLEEAENSAKTKIAVLNKELLVLDSMKVISTK